MTLTDTQRTFLTGQLLIKPRKKEALHIRSKTERKDDALSGIMEKYLRREGKTLEAVRTLETVPGTATMIADFERDIAVIQQTVRTATRDTGESVLKKAYKDLEDIKERAKSEVGDRNGALYKRLKAARADLQALENHAQKAHSAGEITEAGTQIQEASDKLGADDPDPAEAALDLAENELKLGKEAADELAKFLPERAAAFALIYSLRGYSDSLDTNLNQADTFLAAADDYVLPANRDFAAADEKVKEIKRFATKWIKDVFIDPPTLKIGELKAKPAAAYIAPRINELETKQGEVDTAFSGEAWRKVLLGGRVVSRLLATTAKTADRRAPYDAARPATENALKALDGFKSIKAERDVLTQRLADADDLASLAQMRIEEGLAALQTLKADCLTLAASTPDREAYATERKVADTELEKLKKMPGADALPDVLGAVQNELDFAASALAQNPAEALDALRRGATALATAKESFKQAAELDKLGGQAGSKDEIAKAVAELRKRAATAGKAPGADLVADDLKSIEESLLEAEGQVKKGELKIAAIPLQTAASLLLGVLTIQQQHAQLAAMRAPTDKRLAALKKHADAKPLAPKITPIETALTLAEQKEKTQAWGEAVTALQQAASAATAAEKAAKERGAYRLRYKALEKRYEAMTVSDPEKRPVKKKLRQAKGHADVFAFKLAEKELEAAEAEMEAIAAKGIIAATPLDAAKLTEAAKNMMAHGGAKLVDQMVKNLPDTASFEILAALASERFGVTMASDSGFEMQAGKKMWEMMAKVPQDVLGNPSLKRVERKEPNEEGGYYATDGSLMVMNGRPGMSNQEFGSKAPGALPADVEDDCKPRNENPIDYFNFATLHEVGHSVDDRYNFMGSRGSGAQFGGWTSYGANVEPIATAVANWAGYNSTPEQRKHVLDLILGNPATPPVAPPTEAVAWQAALNKVKDWHTTATGEPFFRQSKSAKLDIGGTIYQEAYKRSWVSYDAAARKRGISAYQFRAPGEWFAELYAAYRSKKLKDSHPSVSWLSTLSA